MICLPGLIVSLLLISGTRRCPLTDSQSVVAQASAVPVSATVSGDSLSAALAAERDGRDDEAEAGFRRLLSSPDRLLAGEANLALGRFLERRDRSAAALAPLNAASAALGDSPDGLAATFLLGEAETDQQDYAQSARTFATYVQAGGPAQEYGRIEAAWALQSTADDHNALSMLLIPLLSQSPSIRQAALGAASDSLARLGNNAAAATDQEALAASAESPSDRSAALLAAGKLLHQAGNDGKATSLLVQVLQQYPESASAGTALEQLDGMRATIDPILRAMVLFRQRRNDAARSTLLTLMASQPAPATAAKATYYLAALDDRADQNDDALAGYRRAIQLDPNGELASDALWGDGQLLQSLDRYADAQAAYSDFATRYAKDDRAGEALANAALMAYLDGRPDDAGSLWNRLAQSADRELAARANLWLGKMALQRGDAAAATRLLAVAQTAAPADYFGLRAAALAAGSSPSIQGAPVNPPADADWTAVESWLKSWAGPEHQEDFEAMQGQAGWREAMALNGLGWQVTPSTLIEEAITNENDRPWALYRAARTLNTLGLTRLTIDATGDLLDLAPGGRLAAPQALLRLDYPVDYPNLVNQDAAADGLDPLLISSLVRQESEFDPAIGSSAGAEGLTQILPGTAADVARTIGMTDYSASGIKRPTTNLAIGSAYLAREAKTENEDLARTLAAYNAGGGNADRWAQAAGGDPDLFYEMVDFGETRSYIRLVSQNYAVYNFLYRGLPRPALAHP
jgi:soluble lytic murein transglycosylase